MQKQLQNKTVSTNFFSLKGGEFDLFEFTMLFHKHLCSFASSRQIPKTSKTLAKHLATSRNENAVQLRKHSVEIVEKHHAHGVDKRRQTSPQNVRTKNSFQIHLLSRLHQVQMNFTEKRSSSPKSWCQTSSSKNNQISMLLYSNSDVSTSFCIISRVLFNCIVKNIKS